MGLAGSRNALQIRSASSLRAVKLVLYLDKATVSDIPSAQKGQVFAAASRGVGCIRWTSTELRALSSFPGCLEAYRSPSPLPLCGSISLSDKLLLVKVQVGSKAYPNAPLAIAQPVTQLWPCPMRTCECLAVPPLPQLLQLPASRSPQPTPACPPTPNAQRSPLGSSDEWRWRWRGLLSARPHRLVNVKRHSPGADRVCLPRLP